MSKDKSKNKVDEAIKTLDISAVMGGQSTETPIKGKVVSLNLKKETFLGIGPMWFTPKNYCITIPSNLTADQVERVRNALKAGILVEGDVYIPPIDRDEKVLDEYWQLIKAYGLNSTEDKSKSMIAFRKLMKQGTDRNWTAKEIAKYCIKQETAGKNRDRVIKLLKDLHRFSMCPDTLLEPIK